MRQLRIITAQEEWRDIPDRPGAKVSNRGNVINPQGRIAKSHPDRKGYLKVRLYVNGHRYTDTVHKLVIHAFGPPKGMATQVNHKNGVKSDNRIENLEWCTNGQNGKHAYDLGLKKRPIGERNANAKLTEKNILDIRSSYLKAYGNKRKLAEKYGISVTHLSYILKSQSWNHI